MDGDDALNIMRYHAKLRKRVEDARKEMEKEEWAKQEEKKRASEEEKVWAAQLPYFGQGLV
jgi:hypothetical protein